MLTIGDRVRISGLITKKEYNGRLGIIQEISDGKILLRIISEARQNHEPRLLKIAPDKLLQAPIVCKSGRILRIGAYVEISGMKKNIDYEGKLALYRKSTMMTKSNFEFAATQVQLLRLLMSKFQPSRWTVHPSGLVYYEGCKGLPMLLMDLTVITIRAPNDLSR